MLDYGRLFIRSVHADPGILMSVNKGEYALPTSLPDVDFDKLAIIGSILKRASPDQSDAGFDHVVYLVFVAPNDPIPGLEYVVLDELSRCRGLAPSHRQLDARELHHLFRPTGYWFVLDDQDRVLVEDVDFPRIDSESFKHAPVFQDLPKLGSLVQYTTEPVGPGTISYLRVVLRYRGSRWIPLRDFETGWPVTIAGRGEVMKQEIRRILFGHEFQRYRSRVSVYDFL